MRGLRHRGRLGPERPELKIVDGDLLDEQALNKLVTGCDAVVHCAGVIAAARDETFHRVNAEGTRHLALAAAAAGVSRFLLVSSIAARHPHLSAYAASKAAAESALDTVPGLSWDVLRLPAVYGPGDRQTLTLFRLVKHGFGMLPAGEKARVSLVYVDDLVAAICIWLKAQNPRKETYELDDGHKGGYSWRTIIDHAARALSVRPRYIVPPGAVLRCIGQCALAWGRVTGRPPFISPGKVRELRHTDWECRDDNFQTATGWRPRVALSQGMRETIAWYREKGWL